MARKKKAEPGAEPKKAGRPSVYARDVADTILLRFEDGERLTHICVELDVRIGTFLGWVYDNRDGIAERYARAQILNAMALSDSNFDIADDSSNDFMLTKQGIKLRDEHVRRSQLRVQTRQWYIEKVLTGTLRIKRESGSDDGTTVSEKALDILERLAAGKAAQAKHVGGFVEQESNA